MPEMTWLRFFAVCLEVWSLAVIALSVVVIAKEAADVNMVKLAAVALLVAMIHVLVIFNLMQLGGLL